MKLGCQYAALIVMQPIIDLHHSALLPRVYSVFVTVDVGLGFIEF